VTEVELKAQLRKVGKMTPFSRWEWFDEGRRDSARADRLIVKAVFYGARCTANEFAGFLRAVPSWALGLLRKMIVRPSGNGVMSITKLRAIDVRIRNEAKGPGRTGEERRAA
jgi:hypothetical protein